MQNFLTNLNDELVNHQRIQLPAGKARFTVIDVADVGHVAAHVLSHPETHQEKAYGLTTDELLTFGEMTSVQSEKLPVTVSYQSLHPISFYFKETAVRAGAGLCPRCANAPFSAAFLLAAAALGMGREDYGSTSREFSGLCKKTPIRDRLNNYAHPAAPYPKRSCTQKRCTRPPTARQWLQTSA